VKRLQEGFLLELTASVEVYKAKIEEISEELQRLLSENEAFRNQLSHHDIEPGNMVSPD
jgi:regulator of replication initiation timing